MINAGQDILGIDVQEGLLRAVCLSPRRRRGRAPALSLALPEGADPAVIGSLLRQALDAEQLTPSLAVLAVGPERGYVRALRPDEPEPAGQDDRHVRDRWITPSGQAVLGVALAEEVRRQAQIADHAGLRAVAVDLRISAMLESLGLLDDEPGCRAGVVVDERQIELGLIDEGAILAGQSRPLPPAEPEAVAPEDDRPDPAADSIVQMLRLARLAAGGREIRQVRLCWASASPQGLSWLAEHVEAEVVAVSPGEHMELSLGAAGEESVSDPAEYAVASGLALAGLDAVAAHESNDRSGPRGFNFLQARRRTGPSFHLTWKHAVVALLLGAMILGGLVSGYVLHRYRTRDRLEQMHEKYAPLLASRNEFQRRWSLVRSWLPQKEQGLRPGYRQILDQITSLFPSTEIAVVNQLEISYDPQTGMQVGSLRGRAGDNAPVYEFAKRLNDSKLFENAKVGAIVDIAEGEASYKKRFSVTFNVRRPEGV